MTVQDLPAAALLSRDVGWPHRLQDWQFVHAIGHGLVACAGDQLIGTAMWWSYEDGIVRLGMVIVKPAIQRAGVGRALMHGVLDRVGDATVVLNATQQGETLYRGLGFRDTGSIVQHQGVPDPGPHVRSNIRAARTDDLARFAEIDALAGGAGRENIIAALLEQGEAVALEDAGEVAGFAICRRFGRGRAIGPVIARDTAGANALVAHVIATRPGEFVRIDVPGDCGLSDRLVDLGLVRADTVVTMIRGELPPRGRGFQIFGVINQALG